MFRKSRTVKSLFGVVNSSTEASVASNISPRVCTILLCNGVITIVYSYDIILYMCNVSARIVHKLNYNPV